MNKETLRMQMLAGVITEGQYKEKLEENPASNLELKSLAKQLYLGFKKLGAAPKLLTTKMEIGKKGSWEDGVNLTIFSGEDTISVNINSKGIGVPKAEGIKNNIEKSFPKAIFTPVNGGKDWEGNPIISFNITPGKDMSESLNESMIGGIVGIGAINQIPPRAKTDYEMAFEHFLGERIENQNQDPHSMEEDLNEADAIAIKKINDKIQNDPEFLKKTKEAMAKAEKGDTTDLASLMGGFGKMFEADELEEGELEEIGIGAVLGGAAIAALAKKAYGAYKNYALKKGMKETGEEKKGSNGIIAKEYMSEKDGKTYWGITYQDDTRDSGYEKPRMFLFTPEKIDKVLNADLKFATSDEDMMADGADQKLGQFIADKVVMLEGEEESYNY